MAFVEVAQGGDDLIIELYGDDQVCKFFHLPPEVTLSRVHCHLPESRGGAHDESSRRHAKSFQRRRSSKL